MAHRHLTPASGSGVGQAKVCYSPGDRGTRKGGKERSSFSGGPSRSDGKGSFAPNPLPETKLIRLFPPYTDNNSPVSQHCDERGLQRYWKTVFRLLPTGITAWKKCMKSMAPKHGYSAQTFKNEAIGLSRAPICFATFFRTTPPGSPSIADFHN